MAFSNPFSRSPPSSCLLSISLFPSSIQTNAQNFLTVHSSALTRDLSMASTAAMTVAMVPSPATAGRRQSFAGLTAAFRPMKPSRTAKSGGRLEVRASSSPAREQLVAGLTAAAVAAAVVIPEVAEAAQPGLSPSLKNFLFSIVAGGVVLAVIGGAVIGVANFDPVKRS